MGASCTKSSLENTPPVGSRLTVSSRNGIDAYKAYHWVVGVFTFSFAAAWASPYLLRTIRSASKKNRKQRGAWFRRTHGRF
jgi:hypothetical protein